VAIELERCDQQVADAATDVQDDLRQASRLLSEVAKDIQALSHRLHSSKLEYLGLVTAAKTFCRELSEQRKVRIECKHSDIPAAVPKEISLCLFRVLQEALQNAVKHSGAQDFSVEIHGAQDGIRLTVSDTGVGFDWRHAINGRGLGLISMRERLRLVNGELSIQSEPGWGTTVLACVPLGHKEHSMAKAG
jgi:signal transduction histidine kinase